MSTQDAINKFFKNKKPRVQTMKPPPKPHKKHEMREKQLEKEIIWSLQIRGYTVSKSGESSVYNTRFIITGMSDLQVFVPGKGVMFMEVKTDTGRQRDTQKRFESLCLKCNLKYVLVHSVQQAITEVENYETK